MSAVITRNTRHGHTPEPPQRADGGRYGYAMFFDGDERIAYADTLEDLLDVLIRGYAEMAEQERLVARIRLAIGAQISTQAYINGDVEPDEWNALTDEERGVLTGSRDTQPAVDFWDPEIPLVLVETGYAPYTDIDQPISGIADVQNPPNMIWLRPIDEWDFLESLHTAGYIRLHQAVAP